MCCVCVLANSVTHITCGIDTAIKDSYTVARNTDIAVNNRVPTMHNKDTVVHSHLARRCCFHCDTSVSTANQRASSTSPATTTIRISVRHTYMHPEMLYQVGAAVMRQLRLFMQPTQFTRTNQIIHKTMSFSGPVQDVHKMVVEHVFKEQKCLQYQATRKGIFYRENENKQRNFHNK